MSRTAYYYKPKLSDDSEIIDVLNKLTDKHNRWGREFESLIPLQLLKKPHYSLYEQ